MRVAGTPATPITAPPANIPTAAVPLALISSAVKAVRRSGPRAGSVARMRLCAAIPSGMVTPPTAASKAIAGSESRCHGSTR